jgi:flavin reductase (DIM6/NTAB) family NADH-FMN oxidoreductase RutF
MSRWASGVTVVAVRDEDDGRIYATTVTSFASVSAEPPRIVISFGPGAQVLPFLGEGSRFAVNVLAADQERVAHLFADPFPVGRSPFPEEGDPLLQGVHASLTCRTERILPVDACRLVVGLVDSAGKGEGGAPLLYHRRAYRSLERPGSE